MAEKISAVYKIINTITGDFYIGSSKNIERRWSSHKCPSTWNNHPNNPMYLDMQKYGVEKFDFQMLEEVKPDSLKEKEQQLIENLKPTYNDRNADGFDVERKKEYMKEYEKTDKRKQYQKKYQKEYQKSNKYKEYKIEYYQQNREKRQEYQDKYQNQLCRYNGETLTLNALAARFRRAGVAHPTLESKKYLLL